MQVIPGPVGMPSEIIVDGKTVKKNLIELGYSQKNLLHKYLLNNISNSRFVVSKY